MCVLVRVCVGVCVCVLVCVWVHVCVCCVCVGACVCGWEVGRRGLSGYLCAYRKSGYLCGNIVDVNYASSCEGA